MELSTQAAIILDESTVESLVTGFLVEISQAALLYSNLEFIEVLQVYNALMHQLPWLLFCMLENYSLDNWLRDS